MFISDKYVNTHNSRKRIIVWLGVAIFCFVFFIIYDIFVYVATYIGRIARNNNICD